MGNGIWSNDDTSHDRIEYTNWKKLAFRREMLLPIIFKGIYVAVNFRNVESFFRGSTTLAAQGAKLVFWVLTLTAALPLLGVFLPALTATGGLACVICVIISCL